jgi:hypothetical protein
MKSIDIFSLKNISYVPSSRTCDAYAEAAAVCLEERQHKKGVIFSIQGNNTEEVQLTWLDINQKIKDNWTDLQEATEYGAICLAIWAVHEMTDYKVIRRSSKLTGFDYWLGDKADKYPFQDKARLEVSGILKGTKSQIKQRVKSKINQTDKSDFMNLPAVIVVVEFSHPLAKIKLKNE